MTTRDRVPTALTIAGSDSGGGAGIQADLKTFLDHGVYGMTAITAVTAQNTVGVTRVDPIPVEGLQAQLEAVFEDLPVHAVKIGMLATAAHVRVVSQFLAALPNVPPIVLDPVMVATSGDRLLDDEAVSVLRDELMPLARLATPNLPEGGVLAGSTEREAIETWATGAPCPILLTGGDETGTRVQDVLVDGPVVRRWQRARIDGGPFHGTGCTLSSAIAARLARGEQLDVAIGRAVTYVSNVIEAATHWKPGSGSRVLPHGLIASPQADGTPLDAPWSLL